MATGNLAVDSPMSEDAFLRRDPGFLPLGG